jgi:hypothetical protein
MSNQQSPKPFLHAQGIRRALLISQMFAVVWWLAALYISSLDIIPVWFDQEKPLWSPRAM